MNIDPELEIPNDQEQLEYLSSLISSQRLNDKSNWEMLGQSIYNIGNDNGLDLWTGYSPTRYKHLWQTI